MTKTIDPRNKLLHHIDHLAALKKGEYLAPINVEIDLSNRCSHGCSWCRFGYTHTRGPLTGKMDKPQDAIVGGDLMDTQLAKRILRQLREAGIKSITWTGGGEPTLHPDFNNIVAAAHFMGLEQGIYTHGGHIDSERAGILKEAFTWVYISLDECTPETFKEKKGVNRFEAVLAGIRNLVAAKGDATITVGFLLHKDNCRQVYNMVQLADSLGVDFVQFRPLIAESMTEPSLLSENTTWVTEAIAHLQYYQDDPFVIADISRFAMYRDWTGHGYATCNGSALQTVITPNGKMWICTDKREHADALLGDLSVDSFADIWARSGGPHGVTRTCRVMCRWHIGNEMMDGMFKEIPHSSFI